MVWTTNPPISTLLPAALSIDETVREELAKANPGTLEPTQAVVSDGQELAVDGGTVTISVVGGIVSATFTP